MSTTITIVVDGPSSTVSGPVGTTAVAAEAEHGPAPADIEVGHEPQAPAPTLDPDQDAGGEGAGPAPEEGARDAADDAGSNAPEPMALEDLD